MDHRLTVPRLRAREVADRAQADAVELLDSLADRALSPGSVRDRVHAVARRVGPAPRHRMTPLLNAFAAKRPHAFFVQVGANDGEQQDPLRDTVLATDWSGILVEPLPYIFRRLTRNYGHLPRLRLENVAIGPVNGPMPFYHLEAGDGSRLPEWVDGLGSFRREVVVAHQQMAAEFAPRIVEVEVPCLTFASLCERNAVERLDLLLTDTEGYDFEILKTIPFDRFRPTLIVYESFHLADEDRAECADRLASVDYETCEYGLDTWCFNSSTLTKPAADDLVPLWRWLTDSARSTRQLAATRMIRSAARNVMRATTRRRGPDPHVDRLFALTEAERGYVSTGHADAPALPADAAVYGYFRGERPATVATVEHPRAVALARLIELRALEEQGGGEVLSRIDEDGAFGAWTVAVPGRGLLSRDRLNSAAEILFLERCLGLLGRRDLAIVELGSGYGRLAHRIGEVLPCSAEYMYVAVDDEVASRSSYYLRFRESRARVGTLLALQDSPPGAFALAVHAEPCGRPELLARWVAELDRLAVPHVFVVADDAKIAPALRNAGYEIATDEPAVADATARNLLGDVRRLRLFAR